MLTKEQAEHVIFGEAKRLDGLRDASLLLPLRVVEPHWFPGRACLLHLYRSKEPTWEVCGALCFGDKDSESAIRRLSAETVDRAIEYVESHSDSELNFMGRYNIEIDGDWAIFFGRKSYYDPDDLCPPQPGLEEPIWIKRSDLGTTGSPPRPD